MVGTSAAGASIDLTLYVCLEAIPFAMQLPANSRTSSAFNDGSQTPSEPVRRDDGSAHVHLHTRLEVVVNAADADTHLGPSIPSHLVCPDDLCRDNLALESEGQQFVLVGFNHAETKAYRANNTSGGYVIYGFGDEDTNTLVSARGKAYTGIRRRAEGLQGPRQGEPHRRAHRL